MIQLNGTTDGAASLDLSNKVVLKPHMFKSEGTQIVPLPEGVTYYRLLGMFDVREHMYPHLNIYANGVLIPRDRWGQQIQNGSHVLIAVVPKGGDGGKGAIFASLALIAISVAAPFAGAALGGFWATGAGIATIQVGLSLVATLSVAALFPPSSTGQSSSSSGSTDPRNYFIAGQSNRARRYEAVKRVFGRHQVFPDLAANPYTRPAGNKEYFYGLYDFGYGPLDLEELNIGESSIYNYENVDVRIHREFTNDTDELEIYTNDVFQENFSIELNNANLSFIATTAPATQQIEIDLLFPRGLAEVNQKDGSLSTESVRMRFAYRVAGTDDFTEHIYAPEYSYDGFVVGTFKTDLNPGPAIPTRTVVYDSNLGEYVKKTVDRYGYVAGTSTININTSVIGSTVVAGTQIAIGGSLYRTTQDAPSSSGVNVNISPPLRATVFTDKKNYSWQGSSWSSAAYDPRGVRIYIYPIAEYPSVRARTNQPFKVLVTIGGLPANEYDVLVQRISLQSDETSVIFDDVVFSAMRSIKYVPPVNLKKPHTLVEIKIRASEQLQGTIQNLNAIATSVLPIYNGADWNTSAPTSNPAWIFAEILRGSANPKPLEDDRLMEAKLLQWSQFCDQLAVNPNDNTGDPKHTCNFILNGGSTVKEVLQKVASTGRASITSEDGKYGVIIDDPTDNVPVQIFTPYNTWDFRSTRSFTDIPDAIRVQFTDPNNGWQQGEVIVYNDGFDETNAETFEDISLFGCINSLEAWRNGRYYLAQGILRQETYQWRTDVENLACSRGSLVVFSHDVPKIGGFDSRVESVTKNGSNEVVTVTLSEPVEMQPATNYAFRVRISNGQMYTGNLLDTPVDSYTVQLDPPQLINIQKYDIFVWGEAAQVSYEMLVKSIQPDNDLTATIYAVDKAVAIYNADTGVIPPYGATTDKPTLGAVPEAVENLQATQGITYVDRNPLISIDLSWDLSVSPIVYPSFYEIWEVIEPDDPDGGEEEFVRIETTEITSNINVVRGFALSSEADLARTWTFVVRGVSAIGNSLPLKDCTQISIAVDRTLFPALPAPTDFDLDVIGDQATFTWQYPEYPMLQGFILKYTPDFSGQDWNLSTTLIKNISHRANKAATGARIGSYLLRAVNSIGQLSPVAIATTTIPSLEGLDIITTINAEPNWIGTFINTEKIADDLLLSRDPGTGGFYSEGEFTIAETYDLGADIEQVQVTSVIRALGFNEQDLMVNWDPLSEVELLGTVQEEDWNVYLQYRTSNDDDVIADWDPISAVDPIGVGLVTWSPYRMFEIGKIIGRIIQFRVKIESAAPTVGVKVTSAQITIDSVERVEFDNDVVAPDTGLDIQFTFGYRAPPALGITQDDFQTGDTYQITNKDRNGFTIRFFNGGSGVQRQFDWQSVGYGKVFRPGQLPQLN